MWVLFFFVTITLSEEAVVSGTIKIIKDTIQKPRVDSLPLFSRKDEDANRFRFLPNQMTHFPIFSVITSGGEGFQWIKISMSGIYFFDMQFQAVFERKCNLSLIIYNNGEPWKMILREEHITASRAHFTFTQKLETNDTLDFICVNDAKTKRNSTYKRRVVIRGNVKFKILRKFLGK